MSVLRGCRGLVQDCSGFPHVFCFLSDFCLIQGVLVKLNPAKSQGDFHNQQPPNQSWFERLLLLGTLTRQLGPSDGLAGCPLLNHRSSSWKQTQAFMNFLFWKQTCQLMLPTFLLAVDDVDKSGDSTKSGSITVIRFTTAEARDRHLHLDALWTQDRTALLLAQGRSAHASR